jgi:dTDP-4-dehydrorhamnose reductase
MSHTALITGATGLLGREVKNAFRRAGWLVVGQGFSRAVPPTILKANLEDTGEVQRLLDEAKYVRRSSLLSLIFFWLGRTTGC